MSLILRFFVVLSCAWLIFLGVKVLRFWFRAKMFEVPVPLAVLVRLELGKVGAGPLLDCYIASQRGELEVTLGELEQLSILGGDPRVVVQEMISAKASGHQLSFREIANQHLAAQPGKVIRLRKNGSGGRENGGF